MCTSRPLNMTLMLYSDNILIFHSFLSILLMHVLFNKDNVAMCIKKRKKRILCDRCGAGPRIVLE